MSATPEQIAELCDRLKKRVLNADDLDVAASFIRAQSERERVLEEALRPFAAVATKAEQAWTSGSYYQPEDYVRPAIRLKHFIAARAALGSDAE